MSEEKELFFGGFIITYNRPDILVETIKKVMAQTVAPSELWIIDNSEDELTYSGFLSFGDSRLKYYKMGYNSGPAGAAAKGLELCGRAGMDWIYWGDDNDPPFRENCFERLLAIRDRNPFAGALGVVGHFFDRRQGVIRRIQTRLLEKKEVIEVDAIAGNQSLIVSGEAARMGISPNPDLFFGFEELDFCLKLKRRGFSLMVECKLFLELREKYQKKEYQRPLYKQKNNLNREYYSVRNLLYIADELTLNSMKSRILLKSISKIFFGFRYGVNYGFKNTSRVLLGIFHFYKGQKGKYFSLGS